ncbi:MAG TPA: ATP-binding cassette domain-containing protein, partial [Acidimicrobiales bacterium]
MSTGGNTMTDDEAALGAVDPADEPGVSPGATVLAVRGVRKTFEAELAPVRALRGVDLEVAAGEFVAIMGPSGCGKSTLLNLVAGLEEPTEGRVTVAGRTALMFQEPALFPWLTAAGNVELALRLRG